MKNVWVMTAWADGADGDRIIGVYVNFGLASEIAIRIIREMERDLKAFTEYETEVKVTTKNGEATYELWSWVGDNRPYQSDVIVITRHEVVGAE